MKKTQWFSSALLALYLAGCASNVNNIPASTLGTFPQQSQLGNALSVLENKSGKASFTVELLPKKGGENLRVGDVFDIDLKSSADAYAHLYLWQASGKVTALTENMPVKAGVKRAFPPVNANFQLKANPPTGNNTLLLIATKRPIQGTVYHDFRQLQKPGNIISTQLGAIETVRLQLQNISDSDWQSAIRDIIIYH